MQKQKTISVRLEGLRPLMFDRYAGDNNTQLPTAEKMYLTPDMGLVIPAINILSLLAAENTKSVCRQFFGKNGKTVALGISSYSTINAIDIPLCDDNGRIVFTGWNEQLHIHKAVARVKNGIPNPKERPVLELPWSLTFDVGYVENKFCTIENLRQAFDMGGTLGLGTFRPIFGRYQLSQWDIA
jgi:hypothetical protein